MKLQRTFLHTEEEEGEHCVRIRRAEEEYVEQEQEEEQTEIRRTRNTSRKKKKKKSNKKNIFLSMSPCLASGPRYNVHQNDQGGPSWTKRSFCSDVTPLKFYKGLNGPTTESSGLAPSCLTFSFLFRSHQLPKVGVTTEKLSFGAMLSDEIFSVPLSPLSEPGQGSMRHLGEVWSRTLRTAFGSNCFSVAFLLLLDGWPFTQNSRTDFTRSCEKM